MGRIAMGVLFLLETTAFGVPLFSHLPWPVRTSLLLPYVLWLQEDMHAQSQQFPYPAAVAAHLHQGLYWVPDALAPQQDVRKYLSSDQREQLRTLEVARYRRIQDLMQKEEVRLLSRLNAFSLDRAGSRFKDTLANLRTQLALRAHNWESRRRYLLRKAALDGKVSPEAEVQAEMVQKVQTEDSQIADLVEDCILLSILVKPPWSYYLGLLWEYANGRVPKSLHSGELPFQKRILGNVLNHLENLGTEISHHPSYQQMEAAGLKLYPYSIYANSCTHLLAEVAAGTSFGPAKQEVPLTVRLLEELELMR